MLENGRKWASWPCISQPASLMVHESIALALNNVVTLDHIINFNAPIIRMVITFLLHGANHILPHPSFPWEEMMRARVVPLHGGLSLWGWQLSGEWRRLERVPWGPVGRAVQAEAEASRRPRVVISSLTLRERGVSRERNGLLTPDSLILKFWVNSEMIHRKYGTFSFSFHCHIWVLLPANHSISLSWLLELHLFPSG